MEDLTGLEANALMESLSLVPTAQRTFRGWSEEDWDAAVDRVMSRGLRTADGRATDRGRDLKQTLDAHTERLASPVFASSTPPDADLLAVLVRAARKINDAGAIPYPNAMGLAAVT